MIAGKVDSVEIQHDRVRITVQEDDRRSTIQVYPTALALSVRPGDSIWTQGMSAYWNADRDGFKAIDARLWFIRQDAGESRPWSLEEAMNGRVLTSGGNSVGQEIST